MQRKKAIVKYIVSMLIFGTVGIFRRMIPLQSAALACFRGAAGALFLLAVVRCREKRPVYTGEMTKNIAVLILTGAMIGFNWILLFEAYNYTTVAVATLCYYMQPTIVILLSPLVFKEPVTFRKGVCTVLSVLGMVMVSGVLDRGIASFSEIRGIVLALSAAVLYAGVVMINKKLPPMDAYGKTIIQLASAAAVLLPYIFLTGQSIFAGAVSTGAEMTGNPGSLPAVLGIIVLLLIMGFVHTGLAYALYFEALGNLKVQTAAMLSYIDPVTAVLLSALVLREKVTAAVYIGAALIIGAALVSEMKHELDTRGIF